MECDDTEKYCYRLDGIVYTIQGVITGCSPSTSRPICKSDGCRKESGILEPFGRFKGIVCCCSKDGCNDDAAVGAVR
ncbi:hypothetical protein AB6A40_007616 [Gnathostoma spinigerum]|uniref:Uncharacterized protein n=1 Tax=Gnathostoma spinigerum TaxID=75299 RepID=A0ABD6ENX9_9BILA